MTKLEFLALCGEHNIEPAIALENDAIIEALKAKDDYDAFGVNTKNSFNSKPLEA
jgi:hypothetical protein